MLLQLTQKIKMLVIMTCISLNKEEVYMYVQDKIELLYKLGCCTR